MIPSTPEAPVEPVETPEPASIWDGPDFNPDDDIDNDPQFRQSSLDRMDFTPKEGGCDGTR